MHLIVRESQPSKALSEMLVTLSGIVTVPRDEHSANASSPIVFVPSGMLTELRLVQP